jgi:hypothetical protein
MALRLDAETDASDHVAKSGFRSNGITCREGGRWARSAMPALRSLHTTGTRFLGGFGHP